MARRWLAPLVIVVCLVSLVTACTAIRNATSSLKAGSLGGIGWSGRAAGALNTASAGAPLVVMLLPRSAEGGMGERSRAFENAARMALEELAVREVRLVVRDDLGTEEGAALAAARAVRDGAAAIIGPIFASQVRAVGEAVAQTDVPVVAFSSDRNVAAPGRFLLSFLPAVEVDRIVSYASSKGKKSFAALVPKNAYGSVASAAYRQAVSRVGGRIVFLESYGGESETSETLTAVAQSVASYLKSGQVDTLFVPDGGERLIAILDALAGLDIDFSKIQLIGTGLWDDPAQARARSQLGAWYASPDRSGFEAFSFRYARRYHELPPRLASLAYDAVTLVTALVRQSGGAAGLTREALVVPRGFNGVDGVFRFAADGRIDRGLAVYEIDTGTVRVVDSAPQYLVSGAEQNPLSAGTSQAWGSAQSARSIIDPPSGAVER